MAKHRSRKIAGVSIANLRRIMKKVAWARAYVSLHCRDGLKDESMKTPMSFADSFISTDFPSANVRVAIGGCSSGRWLHLSGLRGRSHFTDQFQDVRRLSSVLSCCGRGVIKDCELTKPFYIQYVRWGGSQWHVGLMPTWTTYLRQNISQLIGPKWV